MVTVFAGQSLLCGDFDNALNFNHSANKSTGEKFAFVAFYCVVIVVKEHI